MLLRFAVVPVIQRAPCTASSQRTADGATGSCQKAQLVFADTPCLCCHVHRTFHPVALSHAPVLGGAERSTLLLSQVAPGSSPRLRHRFALSRYEVYHCVFVCFTGLMCLGRDCPHCGGALVDVLLDWEDELRDYEKAVDLSKRSVSRQTKPRSGLFVCRAERECVL